MEEKKPRLYYKCSYCNVTCENAAGIYQHMAHSKHLTHLKSINPGVVPNVLSVQEFVDVYMKDEAVLGLEYLQEVPGKKSKNSCYFCHLCPLPLTRADVICHVTGTRHMEKYLNRHHRSELDPEYWNQSASLKRKAIKTAALNVHKTKSAADASGPTAAKVTKYTDHMKANGIDIYEHPATSQQNEPMPNPLLSMEVVQKDVKDKMKPLQFKDNVDFLNYLRDCEIRNDCDAEYLSEITKNCAKAMAQFQEEQNSAALQAARSGGVHTEASGQARDSHVLDRIDSCLSRCETALSEDTTTTVGGISDATEVVFSSIKNMEESEVVSVFENIAATNPAFKGIDIPNVMRYLQETARLK